MSPGYAPSNDNLSNEQKALIRIALYGHNKIYILPTVKAECSRIPDKAKLLVHTMQTILSPCRSKFDEQRVEARAKEFLRFHNKEAVCRILATRRNAAQEGRFDWEIKSTAVMSFES